MVREILITRPEPFGGELSQLFAVKGWRCHCIPTLEIIPCDLTLEEVASAAEADIIIFTSRYAVKYAPKINSAAEIIAVGASTQEELRLKGYDNVTVPEEFSSEGVLSLSQLQQPVEKNVVIVTGEGGRELIENTVRLRGGYCWKLNVYRRISPAGAAVKIQRCLKETALDYVICTSCESLTNFLALAGEQKSVAKQLALVVVSQRIAIKANELGFVHQPIVIHNASNHKIVECLHQQERKQC